MKWKLCFVFVLVHIEYGTPQSHSPMTPAKGDNKDLAEGEDKNYPSRLKELTISRRQAMNGDNYRDQPLNDQRGRLFAALRDHVLARPAIPAQLVVRQNRRRHPAGTPVFGPQPVATGGNRRWQTNQITTQKQNIPKPISTRRAVLQHNDNAQMSSRLRSLPKIFERSQSSKIPQPISTSASSRRSYVPPPTQPQSQNRNDARFFDVSQSSKIPQPIGTSASSRRSYIRPPTQPQSPNQNDARFFDVSQSSKIPRPIGTSASSRRYIRPQTQPQSPNRNAARFFDVSQSSKIPRLIGTSASSPRSYIRPPTQPQSPNRNDARCPQLGCGPNKTRPNSGLRPPSAIWRDRSQIKSRGYMKSLMEQAQSRPGPIRRPPRLRPAIPNWQKRQQSKNRNYARFLEK